MTSKTKEENKKRIMAFLKEDPKMMYFTSKIRHTLGLEYYTTQKLLDELLRDGLVDVNTKVKGTLWGVKR